MNDDTKTQGSWMMRLHEEVNRLRMGSKNRTLGAMEFALSFADYAKGMKDPLIEKAMGNIDKFPTHQPSS